jgi:hypothetical protein
MQYATLNKNAEQGFSFNSISRDISGFNKNALDAKNTTWPHFCTKIKMRRETKMDICPSCGEHRFTPD